MPQTSDRSTAPAGPAGRSDPADVLAGDDDRDLRSPRAAGSTMAPQQPARRPVQPARPLRDPSPAKTALSTATRSRAKSAKRSAPLEVSS